MSNSLISSHKFQLLAVAGCLLTAACGATGTENADSQQEDLGEAACATIPADTVQSGVLNFTSPTTYSHSTCYKAYIADLDNATANNEQLVLLWYGTLPTNQADCNLTRLWEQEYIQVNGAFSTFGGKIESEGFWNGTRCIAPSILLDPNASGSAGITYRFAVSARSGGASGPTVSFLANTSP